MPGHVDQAVAGRYRLLGVIGRGGMGVVWRARDEYLHREVAVKELLLPAMLDAEAREVMLERFVREARAAARLDHPSIIDVYDVVVHDGLPWIVMRLVRGRSLDRMVRDDGPLPPTVAAWIGVQVLDALAAAHAEGILHRDVTPRNVLVDEMDRAVLTDFGIASITGATALTVAGGLIGSPGYIAPERFRGAQAGPESDLWSLGATLYFAVEGEPAYAADELPALIGMVLSEDPPPPKRAGPLASTLTGLMARDPAARPTAEATHRRLVAATSKRTTDRPVLQDFSPATGGPPAPVVTHPPTVASPTRRLTDGGPQDRPSFGRVARRVASWWWVGLIILVLVLGDPFHLVDDGRFATAPEVCTALTTETVNRLVPAGVRTGTCGWKKEEPPHNELVVETERLSRSLLTSGLKAAHERFARNRGSGAEDVADLGDEASMKTSDVQTDVWFRVSNLVVTVTYRRDTGDVPSRAGAVEAAREIAAYLRTS
jgi:Protein kinase domain